MMGCFGNIDESFVTCTGIENSILKISSSLPNYEEILDYLDKCSLYDSPVTNYNAIKNILLNINNKYLYANKKIWSEKEFYKYRKFVSDHKECGLYLRLILSDLPFIDNTNQMKEKRILIKNTVPKKENQHNSISQHKNIFIRGRGLNMQTTVMDNQEKRYNE